MPSVFALEKGDPITSKMVGPSALYLTIYVYLIEGDHLFYGHISDSL